jgi:DNA-binding transcriptional regulator YiaG
MPTSHEDLMVDDKTQLAALLRKLQILNREAATYCGVQERTVYKWLAGDRKVPKSVLKLFELMLEQKRGKV